jgi:hypothetical protein
MANPAGGVLRRSVPRYEVAIPRRGLSCSSW